MYSARRTGRGAGIFFFFFTVPSLIISVGTNGTVRVFLVFSKFAHRSVVYYYYIYRMPRLPCTMNYTNTVPKYNLIKIQT